MKNKKEISKMTKEQLDNYGGRLLKMLSITHDEKVRDEVIKALKIIVDVERKRRAAKKSRFVETDPLSLIVK